MAYILDLTILTLLYLAVNSSIVISAKYLQHETSTMSFELHQNTTAVIFDKACRKNVLMPRGDGLFGKIKFLEDLATATERKENQEVYILADSSRPKHQIGILKENVDYINVAPSHECFEIEIINSLCENCKEIQLADNLIKLVDTSFPIGKSISVIIDDDIIGDITLKTILEKSIAHGRNVATIGFVHKIDLRYHLAKIAQFNSHVIIMDYNQRISTDILKMAKTIGLAGGGSQFTWLLTERTMASLSLSWLLPSHNVFGIKMNCSKRQQNISYFLPTVKECNTSKCAIVKHMDKVNQIRCEKVKLFKLQTDVHDEKGKSWEEIAFNGMVEKKLHENKSPSLPRLRIAFANSYPPWLLTIDFAKTKSGESRCGRSGRYGYRYANGTSNVKVPICAYGIAIDILGYLEEMLHFVGEIHITKDGRYGTVDERTGKPDGILGALYRNESDFGIDMAINPTRRAYVEFTTPYQSFAYHFIYIKQDQYKESGVLGPFSSSLWMAIFGMIVALVLYIWGLEKIVFCGKQKRNKRANELNDYFSFLDSFNYMWGLFFCGEIITEKPVSMSSRTTVVFMSFVSILVIAAYSGNLIAFLVVADDTPLVTGLRDPKLVGKDSKLKACALNSSITETFLKKNEDANIRELFKRMTLTDTHKEGMEKLKARQCDLVMEAYEGVNYELGIDKTCSLQNIPVTSQVGGTGFSYRKDFTWKQKFKEAAIKMATSGITDDLFKKWLPRRNCIATSDFKQLGKEHLYVLFLWISIGAGVCILQAMCVWTYHSLRHALRTSLNFE